MSLTNFERRKPDVNSKESREAFTPQSLPFPRMERQQKVGYTAYS